MKMQNQVGIKTIISRPINDVIVNLFQINLLHTALLFNSYPETSSFK